MKKTILVVDDSATVRKLVGKTLELSGFNVVFASDGMEALEKLPAQPCDLLLTDLNMPNVDGIELIRTIRETDDYRELPVIVLSSLADEENRTELTRQGIKAYIQKPFDKNKILYQVSKYLS